MTETVTAKLTSGLGLLISMGTLIGMFMGGLLWVLSGLDAKYASAGDLDRIAEVIRQSEISRIEYQIEEAERRYKRLMRIAEPDRTVFDREEIIDLESRREFLLRELKRMEDAGSD